MAETTRPVYFNHELPEETLLLFAKYQNAMTKYFGLKPYRGLKVKDMKIPEGIEIIHSGGISAWLHRQQEERAREA